MRWSTALAGLLLSLSALVGLSGPGRIDIVDGQTRYEAARSLVTHGDLAIRNDHVWFGVYPGRNGERHTDYRLPQIVLGAAAVLMADAIGPESEARRHFFFTLTSALAAGSLGLLYAVWFRHLGRPPTHAVLLGALGVVGTPLWFYGTSTFDDILGTLAVVASVVVAVLLRGHRPVSAGAVGLLVGASIHCKPPLGAFVLLALAAAHRPGAGRTDFFRRTVWLLAGVALMVTIYVGLDLYRFPPEVRLTHGPYRAVYVQVWPGHPVVATLALLLSPGTSMFLYNPAVVLVFRGLRDWFARERSLIVSCAASVLLFGGVIVSMTIFKGDPAWGPRYFTPVFGVLWLFLPGAMAASGRRTAALILAAGIAVQSLALAVDPHRLYVEHRLPNMWTAFAPQYLFHPALSHLLQRPREVVEILTNPATSTAASPAWTPTAALPLAEKMAPEAITRYHVFSALRPWWIWYWRLDPGARPVSILPTVAVFVGIIAAGVAMLTVALRGPGGKAGTYRS